MAGKTSNDKCANQGTAVSASQKFHKNDPPHPSCQPDLQAVLDSCDGYIYLCSKDYRIEFMNEKLKRRTGRDATGEPCYQALHGLDEVCSWCVNDRVFKGETVRWEVKSPLDNRWYYIVNTPVRHSDGSLSKQAMILDITDRKDLEQALRGKESMFRHLLDNTGEAIYGLDLDGNCIFANKACLKLLGYKDEQLLLGSDVHRLIHHHHSSGGQYPQDQCRILQAIKEGKGVHVDDEVFWRQDGTSFSVEYWSFPIRHNDTLLGAVVSFVDISQRRQSEDALRVSEKRYRQLFTEMVSGGSLHEIITDAEGHPVDYRFLEVNPAFERLTGLRRNDVVGKTVREIMPRTEKYWIDTFGEVALTGRPARIENYARELFRYYDVHAFSPSKNLFATTFSDITERKMAEAELKRTSEQLSVLLETLPVIPFTCSTEDDLPFIFIAPNIKSVTGFAAEKFLDDRQFWLSRVHPEDLAAVKVYQQTLFVKKKLSLEYRFCISDGTYKWFSCSCRLVKDEVGKSSHIAGVMQDISEEKRIRQESEARLQQIIQADKLASLGEVVAGVAHEINNPNSFIGYNLPLMQETWELVEPILRSFGGAHPEWHAKGLSLDELCHDMAEIIKAVKTGSDRINRVVNNLKDFARLDESERTAPVQVNEVVQKAYDIVGAQARKYIGSIEFKFGQDLPDIHGHFQKLEQVVANMIMNSAYATQSREKGRLNISTHYVKRLAAVMIVIEDNGIGMEQVVLKKIFEPFFTTRRESGGTGLGLSVSYGLVQEHNGTISVLSRPGRGSRFTIFLPLDRRSQKIDIQPSILCVDDDSSILNLFRSFFAKVHGMLVATTSDPHTVIDFMEEHPEVDMVVTDVRMAGMDGWQLFHMIRERFPLVPVLMMSGHTEELEREIDIPAPEYLLLKPINFEELHRMINAIGRMHI